VARLGLLKEIERLRPHEGFNSAIPAMLGEIKCHFRAATWTLRMPPRALLLGLLLDGL
jgi:hypothetical protein